jgi:hypothetical protein
MPLLPASLKESGAVAPPPTSVVFVSLLLEVGKQLGRLRLAVEGLVAEQLPGRAGEDRDVWGA